jgi:hypothetical protein
MSSSLLKKPPVSAEAPAGTTTRNCRIVLVIPPDVEEAHQDQVRALRGELQRLVAKYPFIQGIDMAEAA